MLKGFCGSCVGEFFFKTLGTRALRLTGNVCVCVDVCRVCQWARLDFALWQEVVGCDCYSTLSPYILAGQHQQTSCGKASSRRCLLNTNFLFCFLCFSGLLFWFALSGCQARGTVLPPQMMYHQEGCKLSGVWKPVKITSCDVCSSTFEHELVCRLRRSSVILIAVRRQTITDYCCKVRYIYLFLEG